MDRSAPIAPLPAAQAALFAGRLRLLNYKKRGFPPISGRVQRLAQEAESHAHPRNERASRRQNPRPRRDAARCKRLPRLRLEEPAQTTSAPAAALRTIGGIDALIRAAER
jgi:hypothetical protein